MRKLVTIALALVSPRGYKLIWRSASALFNGCLGRSDVLLDDLLRGISEQDMEGRSVRRLDATSPEHSLSRAAWCRLGRRRVSCFSTMSEAIVVCCGRWS